MPRRTGAEWIGKSLDKRRFHESDVEWMIYRRPLGNRGLHVVERPGTGQRMQVSGEGTYTPLSKVPVGSYTGTEGRVILTGLGPPGASNGDVRHSENELPVSGLNLITGKEYIGIVNEDHGTGAARVHFYRYKDGTLQEELGFYESPDPNNDGKSAVFVVDLFDRSGPTFVAKGALQSFFQLTVPSGSQGSVQKYLGHSGGLSPDFVTADLHIANDGGNLLAGRINSDTFTDVYDLAMTVGPSSANGDPNDPKPFLNQSARAPASLTEFSDTGPEGDNAHSIWRSQKGINYLLWRDTGGGVFDESWVATVGFGGGGVVDFVQRDIFTPAGGLPTQFMEGQSFPIAGGALRVRGSYDPRPDGVAARYVTVWPDDPDLNEYVVFEYADNAAWSSFSMDGHVVITVRDPADVKVGGVARYSIPASVPGSQTPDFIPADTVTLPPAHPSVITPMERVRVPEQFFPLD